MGYFDKDGKPIDVHAWEQFFSDMAYRGVALDKVGRVTISTVWLGIDHSFGGSAMPVIFETMVDGGPFRTEIMRYSTLDAAKQGHARWVETVKRKVQLQ